MSIAYNPSIVTDGLVLYLDAGNKRSYPGNGTTWFDISGNEKNFSIDATYATYDSQGYFSVTQKVGYVFTGPASNSFGFSSTNEHTVISWAQYNTKTNSVYFDWKASPNTGTDNRAIYTHFPYGAGTDFYYDVSGCCGPTQRISSTTAADNFLDSTNMATWRTRTDTIPNRQFFENLTSTVDSGSNETATVTWNVTTGVGLCNVWVGKIYNILAYNRALTDIEIQQNFNALRGRYGI